MAYEKIGFSKGDVLKAEHLNHMKEGISGIKIFHIYGEEAAQEGNLEFENVSFFEEASARIMNNKPTILCLHFLNGESPIQSFSSLVGNMTSGDDVSSIIGVFSFGVNSDIGLIIMADGTVTQS